MDINKEAERLREQRRQEDNRAPERSQTVRPTTRNAEAPRFFATPAQREQARRVRRLCHQFHTWRRSNRVPPKETASPSGWILAERRSERWVGDSPLDVYTRLIVTRLGRIVITTYHGSVRANSKRLAGFTTREIEAKIAEYVSQSTVRWPY
jgi:hypothetical protein